MTNEQKQGPVNSMPVHVYYFTDPLCSHCWALDTVLTRFKWEYGDYFELITVMGAMTEDDNHYTDLSGPEAKEQASHWEQVGLFYHIPINGKIWMKDPITSSYPSSIVYLLLKQKDEAVATKFLRMVRESAFVFEKNIAKREVLAAMLSELGQESEALLDKTYSEAGKKILYQNLLPMTELGVNGFPTVVMVNNKNEGIKVVGSRTLETYKKALVRVLGDDVALTPARLPDLAEYLDRVPTVFFNEIEKMYDISKDDVKKYIEANLPKDSYRIGTAAKYKYVQKA